jgi:pilus assembly protein Flp/PilA
MFNAYATIVSLVALAKDRVREEKGATAVEYGLLVALIAIAIIVGISALAGSLNGIFNRTASSLG